MLKPEVKKSPPCAGTNPHGPSPNETGSQSPDKKGPLDPEQLRKINAYWRAANYLSVGQIYLCDNPLLREPLKLAHVKQLLLGHWGTTPGQNFIYAHLNRVIKQYDLNMIYVSGPGHGAPAVVGNVYLEGTYSEVYPNISQDEAGLKKLFKQFSFPGGISSHVSPQTPGSIHEGGELGYSISHAFGAAFDNPGPGRRLRRRRRRSRDRSTGHRMAFQQVPRPGHRRRGAADPAPERLQDLQPDRPRTHHPRGTGALAPRLRLDALLRRGRRARRRCIRRMAATLDKVVEQIQQIQHDARIKGDTTRPRWPMIVLRSLKGWTGPKFVDGLPVEGTFRAHQVPLSVSSSTPPEHLKQLESWMRSYKPEELFDEHGRLVPELAELAPKGDRRMGANPHANGGKLLRELRMPDFRDYAVNVPSPAAVDGQDMHVLGPFLRDVIKLNEDPRNFRIFGPDETVSNRLEAVFEVTNRQWEARTVENDEFLAPDGSVMEMLSEHQCEGWLEGYLLTGRHGLFNSYEAFIRIVDSMFTQHAKWLKMRSELPWRRKIASLNYLLTSHVWRQDHNGFTHQDPGFIDHVINKKSEIVRVYLPPDANCLLSVMDHCLRSLNYINVVVCGKHALPQWLTMDAAVAHCTEGIGIWQWASNDQGGEPDVVMACCGDVAHAGDAGRRFHSP